MAQQTSALTFLEEEDFHTSATMSETKLQTDANARAHSLPVTLFPGDWTAIMTEFRNKHGTHNADDRLPAQSCFENFAERHADGTLKAEPLSRIVSSFEVEQQDARKTDTGRQYNLHLDARLTISTKEAARQHRADGRERSESQVLDHGETMASAQMRQPGRAIYTEFDQNTFADFLDKLLDRDNFNFYKEVDFSALIFPQWSYCLSCEASEGGDQALQGTINGDQSGAVDRAF